MAKKNLRSLPEKLLNFFITHQLDVYGQKIALGCSGGLDSTVLAHLLHQLQSQLKFEVSLLHFNHDLRGNSSDQDEKHVKKLSESLGFKFKAQKKSVGLSAQKEKKSIEVSAREARYAFFEKTLKKEKISILVTAHHAEDQIETLFLNFIRGTGLEGLTGIDPVSTRKSFVLIRPLLDVSKDELKAYANKKQLTYCEDHTNQETRFWRNKIRHEIIPRVKEINPGIHSSFKQMTQLMRSELNEIHRQLQKIYPTCLLKQTQTSIVLQSKKLYTLPYREQRWVVREACRQLQGHTRDVSFEWVENFLTRQLNCIRLKDHYLVGSKEVIQKSKNS